MARVVGHPQRRRVRLTAKAAVAQPKHGGLDPERIESAKARGDLFASLHRKSEHVTITAAEDVEGIAASWREWLRQRHHRAREGSPRIAATEAADRSASGLVGLDRRDQLMRLIERRHPMVLALLLVLQNVDFDGLPGREGEVFTKIVAHAVELVDQRTARDPHLAGPPAGMRFAMRHPDPRLTRRYPFPR